MSDVRINIDLLNGVIDIEGDSDFVDKQIARFEDEIKNHLTKSIANKSKASMPSKEQSEVTDNNTPDNTFESQDESYEDIFESHEDKTHIIKDIPGKNIKEKIIGVSLLLAFSKTIGGNGEVLLEDIRNECTRHGCMDAKNFSRYVKSYSTLMIDSGSGKSATLKLTMPGIRVAKDLIGRIRSSSIGDFFSALSSKPKAKSRKRANSNEDKSEVESGSASSKKSNGRPGPGEIIKRLAGDGFFDSPKTADKIIEHCRENLAYTYKMTDLSPSLTRATRSKLLTRSKDENGQYEYTSVK